MFAVGLLSQVQSKSFKNMNGHWAYVHLNKRRTRQSRVFQNQDCPEGQLPLPHCVRGDKMSGASE